MKDEKEIKRLLEFIGGMVGRANRLQCVYPLDLIVTGKDGSEAIAVIPAKGAALDIIALPERVPFGGGFRFMLRDAKGQEIHFDTADGMDEANLPRWTGPAWEGRSARELIAEAEEALKGTDGSASILIVVAVDEYTVLLVKANEPQRLDRMNRAIAGGATPIGMIVTEVTESGNEEMIRACGVVLEEHADRQEEAGEYLDGIVQYLVVDWEGRASQPHGN